MFLTMTFILLYFDMKNKVSLKSSNLNSKITLLFLFLCNKQTNKYCWHPFPSSNLWVLQPAVFYQIQMPFFGILQCCIFLFCFWSWIECGLQGVAPRCALRAVPSRNTGWATQLLTPLNTSQWTSGCEWLSLSCKCSAEEWMKLLSPFCSWIGVSTNREFNPEL